MNSSFFSVFLLLALSANSFEYSIMALQTGTIVVEDKFIRLNTCITKKAKLKLTKDYFQKYDNIEAIAGITQLNMDDKLTIQFYHKIICTKAYCQFQLNLQRYTPIVNEHFNYSMTFDFLIAHGLKTLDLNMTYYRHNFKMPTFQSQLNLLQSQEQQWAIFHIPYGFSDIKLTANVQIVRPLHSDNVILKYNNPNQLQSQRTSMGWTNQQKFVLYKILFIPKQELQNTPNGQSTFFTILKSAKNIQSHFKLYFREPSSMIQTDQAQANGVQLFNIPMSKTVNFEDYRQHQLLTNIQTSGMYNQGQSGKISRIVYGAIFLLCLQLGYLFYKNKIKRQVTRVNKAEQSISVIVPELIITFSQNNGKRINKNQVNATGNETQKKLIRDTQTVV